VTVKTYVAVAFDVKHKAAGVRPPIPNYGVIAIICPDDLQNITLFLGSQRSGLFERQRRMSLRHDLRLTTFAKFRNGWEADLRNFDRSDTNLATTELLVAAPNNRPRSESPLLVFGHLPLDAISVG
jgi:hypothetical protein